MHLSTTKKVLSIFVSLVLFLESSLLFSYQDNFCYMDECQSASLRGKGNGNGNGNGGDCKTTPGCQDLYNWPSWMGGAVLGAVTGAITGWVVCGSCNNKRGSRGKQGEQGLQGIMGDPGFTANTTNQILFSFTNLNTDATLTYMITLFDPLGAEQYRQEGITSLTIPNEPLLIPAIVPKVEGIWTLVVQITEDATLSSSLGQFVFQVDSQIPQGFQPQMASYTTATPPLIAQFIFP